MPSTRKSSGVARRRPRAGAGPSAVGSGSSSACAPVIMAPRWLRAPLVRDQYGGMAGESLAPADRDERLCEAYFYIGQQLLAEGNGKAAANYFRLAAATNIFEFVEHNFALYELQQLAVADSGDGSGPAT